VEIELSRRRKLATSSDINNDDSADHMVCEVYQDRDNKFNEQKDTPYRITAGDCSFEKSK
jgi:hypothetical protein